MLVRVLALAAMTAAPNAIAATSGDAGVSVEMPWMRLIIKERPAAGYFTLRNDTGGAIELTGASSSACGMLMLHQSTRENGVDRMVAVTSVTVPAHGELSFSPGGYHLMCMYPGSAMAIGQSVSVTLQFAGGNSVTAQFPVRGAGAK